MNSKIDVKKSISKYLPKIHQYFKDKGIKASKEDYIRVLKKNIGDVDETDIVGGMDEFIGKDGDFISGDMNFNKRETFVGINNPETSSEFSQQTSQGPRYYWGSQYGSGRRLAENKMKKMIEDYLGRSGDNHDVVSKTNEIPEINILKYDFNKPIVARKTKTLTQMIEREGLNGEEIAIIINHILSANSGGIPSHYKKILMDKIKNG